ncbi:unnamed protein product [Ascophyllum nodosum]
MNGYCIFAQYCYYEYTCLHSSTCVAPARDSPLFSNEPIFPQLSEKIRSSSVASINPSKMDAASPSAPSRASIVRRWMLHHLLPRARRGSYAEATVQGRPGQRLPPWGGHLTA